MKIKELVNFNIFSKMNLNYWADNSLVDLLYLARSGLKTASPIVELVNGDYNKLASILLIKYKDKWDKVNESLKAEYALLDNVTETISETNTTTETGTSTGNNQFNSSGTSSNDSTVVNSVKPLGNADFADKDRTLGDNSSSNSSSGTTNSSSNNSLDRTNTREYSRHGNIGVTSPQQMITQELELRNNLLMEIVMSDVDNELTLSVYEEE